MCNENSPTRVRGIFAAKSSRQGGGRLSATQHTCSLLRPLCGFVSGKIPLPLCMFPNLFIGTSRTFLVRPSFKGFRFLLRTKANWSQFPMIRLICSLLRPLCEFASGKIFFGYACFRTSSPVHSGLFFLAVAWRSQDFRRGKWKSIVRPLQQRAEIKKVKGIHPVAFKWTISKNVEDFQSSGMVDSCWDIYVEFPIARCSTVVLWPQWMMELQ